MNATQMQELAQNAAKAAICAYFKKTESDLFKKGFGKSKTQLDALIAVRTVLEKTLCSQPAIDAAQENACAA